MPSISSRQRARRRMPHARSMVGRALPARFRRERLLVVGCGDVALRLVRQLQHQGRRWLALTSDPTRLPALREAGVLPLLGDLDQPASLRRLAGLGQRLLHLAPPARQGRGDARTGALLAALARRGASSLRSAVYVSTSGVYGDCQGAWVDETRAVAPQNPRAWRRVDAERRIRALQRRGVRAAILRAPGIYALDRPQGGPVQRLRQRVPTLRQQDDVFTNHIHADDLARACWLALWRARPLRVFNASDDSDMRLGDYLDSAADLLGLPRPPRIARDQADQVLGELRMSFLRESRRLRNQRIKAELRMGWRYPTVLAGLAASGAAQP